MDCLTLSLLTGSSSLRKNWRKVVLWWQTPYKYEIFFIIVTHLSRIFLRIVKSSSMHRLQLGFINYCIDKIVPIWFNTLNIMHLRPVPWKRDNLLVEADVFIILGVSFCVRQNTFNFIKIKNKNIGAHFRKSYMPLCNNLLKLMELLVPFSLHKIFLVATASLSFLMVTV